MISLSWYSEYINWYPDRPELYQIIIFYPVPSLTQRGDDEEIPDNLKGIFGNKLGDISATSDHSAQSSISEPDSVEYPVPIPNEELSRVLGLLSEEQARSQSLEEKIESMEKQLQKSRDLERELERVNSKVLELNRRFEDASRAYEQEKKVSDRVITVTMQLYCVRC